VRSSGGLSWERLKSWTGTVGKILKKTEGGKVEHTKETGGGEANEEKRSLYISAKAEPKEYNKNGDVSGK